MQESSCVNVKYLKHQELKQIRFNLRNNLSNNDLRYDVRIKHPLRNHSTNHVRNDLRNPLDPAIRDFEQALEMDEGNRSARDGVARAKRLKKQAGKRDYYKILGVDRRTEKKDIIKAYR